MSKFSRSGQSWSSRKRKSSLWKKIEPTAKKLWKKAREAGIVKNALLAGIALFFIGTIFFLGLFAFLSRDLPDPNSLSSRDVAQSTKIYDNTGEHLLYEIYGDENRTLVKFQEDFCGDENLVTDSSGIPLYAVQATIAAEDHTFCTHKGFSVKGILRAVIFHGSRGGGSTLTQQLVKNAILTNERTITRKVKELILSIALERRYTKDEILQIYFNEIPYGSTYYGIEAASQNYFDKHVTDLSLAEAATLAGLPQIPTYYVNNPDKLETRRNWILDNMVELDFISEQEADEAKKEELVLQTQVGNITAPHFVLWVKEQLVEEYGERLVEQGGLTVVTTLDYDKQRIAEEAIKNNKEARGETYGFNNSGLVAMNPQNGQIVAMAGSADYFDDDIDGQVNVTLRPLQPGSSMKPIVYTAGFEKGYTPNSILWDTETDFPSSTGPYHPRNYDLSEHGPVTIRKALQGSLNITAVKMLALIGVDAGLDFAERLHYSTFEDRSKFGLAIVLGGAEVKLIDHTAAYATFASEGVYHEPVSILKVSDPAGEVLQEWKEEKGERVIDENTARTISNVLSDDGARAYAFGAGSLLTLPGRPVAAKTGTTNDYNDAWTMGYTPQLVAGVWTGNTNGSQMNRGSGGSSVAAPVWNEFMRNALAEEPVVGFTAPSIPITGKPILDGQIPAETVTVDSISGKLATEYTPDRYRETKTCGEFHTILHFINPANPRGEAPKNPEKNYLYESWEAGVQAWLEKQRAEAEETGETPMESCEIPTEEDDVHTPENQPTVSIRSPRRGEDVGRSFDVDLRTNARRNISRVEYYIDGKLITVGFDPSGTRVSLPSWVGTGNKDLKVIAYDDVDNSDEDSVSVSVREGGVSNGLSITNPFNNQEIEQSEEPYTVVVEASGSSGNLDFLTVSVQNLWTGKATIIGEDSHPGSFNSFAWTPSEPGQYLVSASGRTDQGTVDASPVIVIVKAKAPDGDGGGLSLVDLPEVLEEEEPQE